ncbi:MAG: glycerol-3-phosphate 1-O-acyltransferase PlsY [bacterium]|nr:glycerol-3-phosphate 1-O-acyltransferase PlsY [bacterium]
MGALLIIAAVAYLLGSLPTAVWTGRALAGVDVRSRGSGNPGATNVLRSIGPVAALFVALVDVTKGWLAAGWAWRPPGLDWAVDSPWAPLVAGAAVVVGHAFPLLAGFRGGKSVATAAGVVAALQPAAALICAGVFLAVAFVTRVVSRGSVAGAAAIPFALAGTAWSSGDVEAAVREGLFGLALAAFVVWRHRPNIRSWRAGTEPRIGR